MQQHIKRKWRPPLALVIGGTLSAVLCLPLLGIAYFRVAGNILGWGEASWMILWMAIAATAILGLLLWRLVLRPVYALTAHANAMKEGRSDIPPPPHFGTPEITALGQAVLDMGTTLQDRAAGLRAYTDHVTHELKSPLTSLIGAAELLDDPALTPEDRAGLIDTVRSAARAMEGHLAALRRLSSAREAVGRGLSDLAQTAMGLALPATVQSNATPVPLDAAALRAVLDQLTQNAARHGATSLELSWDGSTLVVQDNGNGFAPADRLRAFDPFFTTARAEGGTGMGLPIVRAILGAVGAQIELDDGPPQTGACFRIRF